MLRVAVCDDEQSYLHDVKRLLDEYGAAHGVELAAAAFPLPFDLSERVEAGAEFDFYLLDVYMPGMTGIELAGQLRRIGIEAPAVFLTTSREHALEAFGVGAAGYLVKPFRREAFFGMLDSVTSRGESERRRNVLLKVGGGVRSVAVRDILYCEAHRNDQCISLADGSSVRLRMTAGELFALLAPSGNFARCGAAYILNLAKLRRLSPKSALMADGAEIPMPRGAYAERAKQMELRLKLLTTQVQAQTQASDEARRARHDLRHHNLALLALAEQGNTAEHDRGGTRRRNRLVRERYPERHSLRLRRKSRRFRYQDRYSGAGGTRSCHPAGRARDRRRKPF